MCLVDKFNFVLCIENKLNMYIMASYYLQLQESVAGLGIYPLRMGTRCILHRVYNSAVCR